MSMIVQISHRPHRAQPVTSAPGGSRASSVRNGSSSDAVRRDGGVGDVADTRSALGDRSETRIAAILDEVRNEICAHFQPVVDLHTGEIVGLEALARWRSGELGDVEPTIWIPLAERGGQIHELGRVMLEQSLDVVRQWSDDGVWHNRTMAVNISPIQLMDPGFVSSVLSALSERRLPPSTLILELTETNPVSDFVWIGDRLRMLRDNGVRIALDDFGTGSANFEHLRELPFDLLKIDRRFVSGMLTSALDRAIVRSVMTVAAELGLEVVAEGVETIEQHHALMQFGGVRAQGFLYARARPVRDALTAVQLPAPPGSQLQPVPYDEHQRLEVLRITGLLDTPAEAEFDRIVQEAAALCDAPIALLGLIDEHRQWFKARVGVDLAETRRDEAVCATTICQTGILEIEDLRLDHRFAAIPAVAMEDGVCSYAGIAIRTDDGFALGTLCVADLVPRTITAAQRDGLVRLAQQASALVAARRHRAENRRNAVELERLRSAHERLVRRSATVLQAIDAGVIVVGADGRVEALSELATSMVTPTDATAIGQLVWRVFGDDAPASHSAIEAWFRAAVEGEADPDTLDVAIRGGIIRLAGHRGADGSGEFVVLARHLDVCGLIDRLGGCVA